MARPAAPSLPTPDQIRKAYEVVAKLHPGARIERVGPKGITFAYPDTIAQAATQWEGKPFSAEGET